MSLAKKISVEKNDAKNARGDCSVGYVKHRAKKGKLLPPPYRHPIGERTLHDGKIKHIYPFAIKHRRITTSFRHKLRDASVIGRFGKNDAVECAIYNIS